jgi:hypothetical protein
VISQLDGADRHTEYSDAELVRRWLHSQREAKQRGIYLWVKVSQVFCVGSTSAKGICTRHGYDPDKLVRFRG